jgi:hypothetical protein
MLVRAATPALPLLAGTMVAAFGMVLSSIPAQAHRKPAIGHTVTNEFVEQCAALGCPHDKDLVMVRCAVRKIATSCSIFKSLVEKIENCSERQLISRALNAAQACLRAGPELYKKLAAYQKAQPLHLEARTKCGKVTYAGGTCERDKTYASKPSCVCAGRGAELRSVHVSPGKTGWSCVYPMPAPSPQP